jgi:hypothetical protein
MRQSDFLKFRSAMVKRAGKHRKIIDNFFDGIIISALGKGLHNGKVK